MKLDRAIAILAAKKRDDVERNAEDSAEACQLGIEALKAIKCGRQGLRTEFNTPLRGETKEKKKEDDNGLPGMD